ncbi:MAG: glycosyltransferase family 4 protein [Gammaproteobacteria bacterium]
MQKRMSVLALAPYCDGLDVGEGWCAFQWVKNLSTIADVTLLALHRKGRVPVAEQLPNTRVITWDEPSTIAGLKRFNSMLKPGYVSFYMKARSWLASTLAAGETFDIAQQFSPIALRYPSPLAGFSIPYVIGPLGGSLETPSGFASECASASWYTRLRSVDGWRLKHDSALKHSYRNASAVLGVAPYVGELLAPAQPRRFEVISELGIDDLAPQHQRDMVSNRLSLVHVGRGVRTKGLRDAVRAIARLPDSVDVRLTSAGQGEEIEICRAEAKELGIEDRIEFLGQVSRAQVEELYARADVFLFPSFREPSGSVVFEALRHGLPVITTDIGGPGYVVDKTCGLTVPAQTPAQLATDLATAITRLAEDTSLRTTLSAGARSRIKAIGLWRNKINWLMNLYEELTEPSPFKLYEVS